MSSRPRILVVAATGRELAPAGDWVGITCGVGPVEAAVATAAAIVEHRPHAVLQVGIAGARRQSALLPGSLVVGTSSHYDDLGELPPAWAVRQIEAPAHFIEALRSQLSGAAFLPIGTSGRVGGTSVQPVEAMEGFSVLRAAQHAGIPAIEVRAISNDIEEHDRTLWHFDLAFDAITSITPTLVRVLQQALDGHQSHA